MIYSIKEKQRRKKFYLIITALITAILICLGVLVGAYFYIRENISSQKGETVTIVSGIGLKNE